MSRRRGEFEHRTSIFEGAFRAWSHLGGLDPEDLETKPPTDMDPLTYPLVHDPRLSGKPIKNPDGTLRREYPYEPLPRSGLSHPYVQAILSPWLGPDADNEAIQLGLTTLRTWWQHRRKGESGSAIAALGTEKMKGVVEGYTRHFFTLAHCIVVNDRVQPPRGLHAKMRELEKINTKRKKKGEEPISMAAVAAQNNTGGTNGNINGNNNNPMNALQGDLSDPNLTPLEKLHVAQRRQLESSGMLPTSAGGTMPLPDISSNPGMIMDMKGKCVPGKVNLPDVVNQVTLRANQFVHRGAGAMGGSSSNADGKNLNQQRGMFGDPNTTPVVFVSAKGDIQIAMKVDGITCAHCVKIVETVLRGCNGNPSPILGLLDAAADRDLHSVLIKIDKASNAKRIAFEAARNLSMVGYTAEPKEMSIVGAGADPRTHMDLGALSTAFEVVAHTESQDVFDWTIPCTCPDNGVLRGDCSRHSQMNTRIFDAFAAREQQVTEYMAGCAMKYGMDCTCGPSCRCKNCPIHSAPQQQQQQQQQQAQADTRGVNNANGTMASSGMSSNFQNDEPALRVDQQMMFNNFDMRPPAANASPTTSLNPIPFNMAQMSQFPDLAQQQQQQHHHQQQQQHQQQQHHQQQQQQQHQQQQQQHHQQQQQQHHQQQHPSQPHHQQRMSGRVAQRNPSTTIRGMSITSETTFGRAMSGLSALSIDWENLDDFDLEIDHSAHINGNAPPAGRRRSSARRSIMSTGSNDGGSSGTQVSFRV